MNNVYLITEQQVRTQSLLGENVDSAFIMAAIQYAQMIDLQEVLGTKLYEEILHEVEIQTFKKTEYRKLLDDYIQPYLIQQVLSEIVVPLQVKYKNAGLIINNDTHYQSMSMNDCVKVRDEYMHKATFLAGRLISFIKNNLEAFADDLEGKYFDLQINTSPTKSPIFFPKTDIPDYDLD